MLLSGPINMVLLTMLIVTEWIVKQFQVAHKQTIRIGQEAYQVMPKLFIKVKIEQLKMGLH